MANIKKKRAQNAPSYNGNTNLKPANHVTQWTADNILEYDKCMNDIEYFAEKYFKIVHIDHGLINVPLTGYQKEILQMYKNNRFNVLLQSRQSYKCLTSLTKLNIRNKKTGEIQRVSIGELFEEVKKLSDMWKRN